ncbi:hypothetical protein D3C83_57780 [compost metagenome]
MHQVDDLIEQSPDWWDTSALGALPAKMPGSTVHNPYYGKVFEGPIIVFTPPSGTACGAPVQSGTWRPSNKTTIDAAVKPGGSNEACR